MVPRIRQVRIRNYKSIGHAVVELDPFTALVGPNGAGKSNFLDALAFVQESLSASVEFALNSRGGIGVVRRCSGGHPTHISICVTLDFQNDISATYEFTIVPKPPDKYRIALERCAVGRFAETQHVFEVRNGELQTKIAGVRSKMPADRLAFAAVSGRDEFRPVADFLTSMRFYSIVPARLREWQEPDPGDWLARDGHNAAAVLKRLKGTARGVGQYDRLCRVLARVAGGVERVQCRAVGQKETLQFRQDIGLKHAWTFDALNMSDGTLRALGLLLSVYQPNNPPLVAIEEPDAMIHPAAAEAVIAALREAAKDKQVLVTTASPDVLDYKEMTDAEVRIVTLNRGRTTISAISESAREAIRKQLYTTGRLLRSRGSSAEPAADDTWTEQMNLFGSPPTGS